MRVAFMPNPAMCSLLVPNLCFMQPQTLNINPALRYDVASCVFFQLFGLLGLWQRDDGKDTAYMGALHRNVLV